MPVRRADDSRYTLATDLSASGSAVSIPGGEYMFFVEGTAGGSTLSLQIAAPTGTWMDVQSIGGSVVVKSLTLPFTATQVSLPAGNVRLGVTGGTPSGLNAYLVGLG